MEQMIFDQLITPVVKFLTSHITKHIGYVACSTKHVIHVKERMVTLQEQSDEFEELMKLQLINHQQVPAGVPRWLKRVGSVREKVKSISSDGSGCLNLKKRYQAGSEAWKDTEIIEDLIKQAKEFSWKDVQLPTGRVDSKPTSSTTSTPSSSSLGGDWFRSREKPFKDALKFLREDGKKSQVIALCGMGGVGKTTMMEQLRTVVHEKKMFDWIVKVVIGRDPTIKSIQNDISLQLGGRKLREETLKGRADRLHGQFEEILKEHKKILVIVDDVWEEIKIQDFGLTSSLPSSVKLFLTSRHTDICKKIAYSLGVDFLQPVRIDALEEAEARAFFSRITGVSEKDDRNLYGIGCDIVKRCGHLPLAMEIIAKTLKFQEDDDVWKATRDSLKNNDLDSNVQEVIKISYDYIKSDEDKMILLHCGLFPEDANISIEVLTRYAWGLKMFTKIYTLEGVRAATKKCVQNLINANLLMSGDKPGCVKMHDLVLVFVLGTVTNGDHPWIISRGDISKWRRDETSKCCQRISLTCTGMSEFPRDFKYPNLFLLQLMRGDPLLKFPEDFYEGIKDLRIIAYYNMQYPFLPRSLECSTKLTTLILHGCELMYDCSFIGDLVNLEVLSFAGCGIRKLPSTIANLVKLKLLDLTGNEHLRVDDGVFRNMVNLEELYMTVSGWKAIRFTDANLKELEMLSMNLCALQAEFFEQRMMPKNMSFKKLDKFKITMGCLLHEGDDVDKHLFRNTLKLVTDQSIDIVDCKINELFIRTEKLSLEVKDLMRLEDVLVRPFDKHSFGKLRELAVSNCAELKYLFTISVASGLRKLERLEVSSCSNLEALVHDNECEINSVGGMIKFEELKFLCLKDLPELVSLVDDVNLVELPHLVELEVDGLPNFTSIYPDKHIISSTLQRPFFNSQVKIPKLEKLKIRYMDTLKQIWGSGNVSSSSSSSSSEEGVDNISMLRSIVVARCFSLVNLFPTNPARLLNHLETLEVIKCGSIESIFNIDLGCMGEAGSSNLRSIYVKDSDNVREVWRIKGDENNCSSNLLTRGFEAVESITIKDCKRFTNIFTPTNTKFDLRSLVSISISKGKEQILKQQVNHQKQLPTKNCQIECFPVLFPSGTMHRFHDLSSLYLWNYSGAEVVFEIVSRSSSSDLETTIDNQQEPLLPNLQYLNLNWLWNMSHVWKCNNWNKFLIPHKQSSFHNLTTITMMHCHKIKYLFSLSMAELIPNLKNIDVGWCDAMEVVVSKRDGKSEEMTTSTSTTTSFFPHLHSLLFRIMRNLKRIDGDDGGATSVIPDQFKFSSVDAPWSLSQYSREIDISGCHGLSTIIPYYAVGRMQKLQVLIISDCNGLMEVFETQGISNNNSGGGGGNGTDNDEGSCSTPSTTLAIPRLNIVTAPKLSNLKKLEVQRCNLLQHVFTFCTLESLTQLEELSVRNCNAMKVIVEKDNEEHSQVVVFPHLKSLELFDLPNLEGFFLGMNKFNWQSLGMFMLKNCPQMNVFTNGHSAAPNLKYIHTGLGKHSLDSGLNFILKTPQIQLPHLENTLSAPRVPISNVPPFHIQLPHLQNTLSAPRVPISNVPPFQIQLPHLQNTLAAPRVPISNVPPFQIQLPHLQNTLSAPRVPISNVPPFQAQVNARTCFSLITSRTPQNIQSPYLENIRLWSFHNLVELDLKGVSVRTIFPPYVLLHLQKLERVRLRLNATIKELFGVDETKEADGGFDVVEFPNLRHVELDRLELQYVWKRNHPGIVLQFPNLITLHINKCRKLEHVFTSSMVGCLLQLQDLHISDCGSMNVIVKVDKEKEEESKSECDAEVKHIELPRLKSLKLEKLASLKGFCLGTDDFSCPSLHTLEIKECPEITVFTNGHVATPSPTVIDTSFGRCYVKEDINSFLKTMQDEGLQF